MKINFITIEREYGSGGTEIAEKLAGKCGIPCYGAEIIRVWCCRKGCRSRVPQI